MVTKIDQTIIKDQSKNDIPNEMHLGIDVFLMWVDFGKQAGRENRTKIEQKSIRKSIEKMMQKKRVLDALLGGVHERAMPGRRSWDPLIDNPQRKTKPQNTKQDNH